MSDNFSTLLGTQTASAAHAPSPTNRYRWFALGVFLLVIVFALLTWQRWIAPPVVDVVRVDVVQADGATTSSNAVAFQAAGWVEADPYVVAVSSLVDGIVSEVPVLNGQAVEQGTIIARLVADEQRLAVEMAKAQLARHEAAAQVATINVQAAEAEFARFPARLAAAHAELAVIRDRSQRLEALGTIGAAGAREQAALQVEAAVQKAADIAGSEAVLSASIKRARAELAEATATISEARVALEEAQLALNRTVIRAPQSGIIQKLYIYPGSKLRLAGDHTHSAIAAELFDPNKLQIRVDVALVDVSRLAVGQMARVSCEALGDRILSGTVTRIDGQADVARNTLQAKIALSDRSPLLRPDMLCRVQFLGQGQNQDKTTARVQLLIPYHLVNAQPNEAKEVWLIDRDSRAQRVQVRFGDRVGDMIEIVEGAPAGAWIIRQPPQGLSVGQRVRAREVP